MRFKIFICAAIFCLSFVECSGQKGAIVRETIEWFAKAFRKSKGYKPPGGSYDNWYKELAKQDLEDFRRHSLGDDYEWYKHSSITVEGYLEIMKEKRSSDIRNKNLFKFWEPIRKRLREDSKKRNLLISSVSFLKLGNINEQIKSPKFYEDYIKRLTDIVHQVEQYHKLKNFFTEVEISKYENSVEDEVAIINDQLDFIRTQITDILEDEHITPIKPKQEAYLTLSLSKAIDNLSSEVNELRELFSLINENSFSNVTIKKFQVDNKLLNQSGKITSETKKYLRDHLSQIISLEKRLKVQNEIIGVNDNWKSNAENLSSKIAEYTRKIDSNQKSIDENCKKMLLLGYDCPINNSIETSFNLFKKEFNLEFDEIQLQIEILEELRINQLKSVLYESDSKSLKELIKEYSEIVEISSIVFDDKIVNSLKNDENHIYLKINGKHKRYKVEDVSLKNKLNDESNQLVRAIRIHNDANILSNINGDIIKSIKNFEKLDSWILEKDEIIPICLTEEPSTIRLFKNSKWDKKNKIVYSNLQKTKKKLEKKIKKNKNKTLIAIGHVEVGNYVDENSNTTISITWLNELAKRYNCNIIHMGCGTAIFNKNKKGTTDIINTYSIAKWLFQLSLEKKTFKDFLKELSNSKIGAKNNKIQLLIDESFSDKGYAQIKITREQNRRNMEEALAILGYIIYEYFNEDKNE